MYKYVCDDAVHTTVYGMEFVTDNRRREAYRERSNNGAP